MIKVLSVCSFSANLVLVATISSLVASVIAALVAAEVVNAAPWELEWWLSDVRYARPAACSDRG
jgi:hypothetical protein